VGPGRAIDTEQDRIGIYSGAAKEFLRGYVRTGSGAASGVSATRSEGRVGLAELAGLRVDEHREIDGRVLA
jgi:hypothetical protein